MNKEDQELKECILENLNYFEKQLKTHQFEVEFCKREIEEEKTRLKKLEEKYNEEWEDSIPLSQMKDGDLGVITHWDILTVYVGEVVQRHGNNLVRIGYPLADSWPDAFKENGIYTLTHNPKFRVKLVKEFNVKFNERIKLDLN